MGERLLDAWRANLNEETFDAWFNYLVNNGPRTDDRDNPPYGYTWWADAANRLIYCENPCTRREVLLGFDKNKLEDADNPLIVKADNV